jgi:high-affinity iron transporter
MRSRPKIQRILCLLLLAVCWALPARARAQSADATASALGAAVDAADSSLIDFYEDPTAHAADALAVPPACLAALDPDARAVLESSQQNLPTVPSETAYPLRVGRLRARAQQAMILEMAAAVRAGRVADAQAWRAQINLPAGVSANEGAMLLLHLPDGQPQRDQAGVTLTREAITWQTARVRELLAAVNTDAAHPDTPLPGRLMEQLGEIAALTDLPAPLRQAAGLTGAPLITAAQLDPSLAALGQVAWSQVAAPLAAFGQLVETHLPALLSEAEKHRRERMLLKLVTIIPTEYRGAGIRDGQINTPLEYREAVTFTAQARQFADELAPLWLAQDSAHLRAPLQQLEQNLTDAAAAITAKRSTDDISSICKGAAGILNDSFHITLHRGGTTADIVDEVMLETRTTLGKSLAAANDGNWGEAQSLRLEAYTTYDPELEARLMPRDPALATRIEQLLLDGVDQPGVKVLLDRHEGGPGLASAYDRVYAALDTAAALLKSSISPTAAAISAGSIVMREGMEGLLVAVAILAGLRGDENAQRRRLFWIGIAASLAATAITWILSQTLVTSLRNYGEVIEAVAGILAIVVLLLITNWLFHQVYWRQWVTTLKSQAAGESIWQLVSVGFLVGYREGFETVLFLQSLVLDGAGKPVALGVVIGGALLFALGIAVLRVGLKLPYYKILLVTAMLIGFVLIIFVGGTVRSAQTVGWLPVHRLTPGSWPAWLGNWLGIYNTVESVLGQGAAIAMVMGTWLVSRFRSRRKNAQRRAAAASNGHAMPARPCASMQQTGVPACDRAADDCCATADACEQPASSQGVPVELRVLTSPRATSVENQPPVMQNS